MEIECKECNGSGVVPVYRGCNQLPSNCCGGCEVDENCEECNGYGVLGIDAHDCWKTSWLHEKDFRAIDKLVDFSVKK